MRTDMPDLYGGLDMARVLYGEHAREIPAWLWIQDAGDGLVSFVGGSRTDPARPHPARYGSARTHQLLAGSIILRPTRLILATDARRGDGLSSLALDPFEYGTIGVDADLIHRVPS